MSASLWYKPTEPNQEASKPDREQEQTKFTKPDEQSMDQLENISQKTNNRKLTWINCNGSPQSPVYKLQTILYSQQNYKQKQNGRNTVSDTTANENMG